MRLGRVVSAANWKYAIGEVVLIVAGVTIALAANSWYENLQERRVERQILVQIGQALEVDLRELESKFELEAQLFDDVAALIGHMQSAAEYDRDIGPFSRSVLTWVGVRANLAPYEALKSAGFDLISNDTLRLMLIYYYENQFPQVSAAAANDRAFATDYVRPYILENFRHAEPGTYFPNDYEMLRRDQYFWNLCMTKSGMLQSRILPRYEATIEMNREILAAIEAELRN